jgi:hypothetical protein
MSETDNNTCTNSLGYHTCPVIRLHDIHGTVWKLLLQISMFKAVYANNGLENSRQRVNKMTPGRVGQ